MTTVGAFVAVLVMVLAPSAAASSAALSLPHDTPIIQFSSYAQGCSKGLDPTHSFSVKTGFGAISEKDTASTCYAIKGGYSVDSDADSYDELGATQNFASLTHNYTSLNGTWNITATADLAASGKIKNCPYSTESFSVLFYNGTGYGSGWINETYQDCYAEAYIYMDPQMEIDDITSGQYWGFGFSGFYATAGAYADNYTETINYTTPGFGVNTTYSCTTCYGSYGPGGVTAINTNVYANVTAATYGLSWAKGDHVQIYAEVFVETGVEIYYAKAASATSSLTAVPHTGHVDLTAFTFV